MDKVKGGKVGWGVHERVGGGRTAGRSSHLALHALQFEPLVGYGQLEGGVILMVSLQLLPTTTRKLKREEEGERGEW